MSEIPETIRFKVAGSSMQIHRDVITLGASLVLYAIFYLYDAFTRRARA